MHGRALGGTGTFPLQQAGVPLLLKLLFMFMLTTFPAYIPELGLLPSQIPPRSSPGKPSVYILYLHFALGTMAGITPLGPDLLLSPMPANWLLAMSINWWPISTAESGVKFSPLGPFLKKKVHIDCEWSRYIIGRKVNRADSRRWGGRGRLPRREVRECTNKRLLGVGRKGQHQWNNKN